MLQRQDVNVNDLIEKMAEGLKAVPEIKAPKWTPYVKTGVHKNRPPVNQNWWHTRVAAILRQVAKIGPIGVSKLQAIYGGKKNRGHKTEHFYKGSGSIARNALQQLEAAGLVKQEDHGGHKGRVITKKGTTLISVASRSLKPKA